MMAAGRAAHACKSDLQDLEHAVGSTPKGRLGFLIRNALLRLREMSKQKGGSEGRRHTRRTPQVVPEAPAAARFLGAPLRALRQLRLVRLRRCAQHRSTQASPSRTAKAGYRA